MDRAGREVFLTKATIDGARNELIEALLIIEPCPPRLYTTRGPHMRALCLSLSLSLTNDELRGNVVRGEVF